MNILTANEAVENFFRDVVNPVEIRAPSGELLGHFTPAMSAEEAEWYSKAIKLFDLEDAERILTTQRNQGRPLEEVKQRLRSLENQG